MSKGILFVMSGPSGTGKGTICDELLKRYDIFLSVSTTTREIRKGETEGVTYNYTTVANFERMIKNDEMLEYAKYGNNYYGTPQKTVREMIDSGKNVLLEIEPQGAMQVKKIFTDAILMFIVPPSMAELKKRLTERGRENEEQIDERLTAARWEFGEAVNYNKVFINDDLDECVEAVISYMNEKTSERNFLNKLLKEEY